MTSESERYERMIKLLLEKLGRLPEVDKTPAEVYITVFDEKHIIPSLQLAQELREVGIKVTTHLKEEKLGKQFRLADRIGAKLALVLGPDELEAGNVSVKDLSSGEQKVISRTAITDHITKILEA